MRIRNRSHRVTNFSFFLGLVIVFVAITLKTQPVSSENIIERGVTVLFDLSSQTTSPFPSNKFTVPDPSQNTGLRIDLPKPDCSSRASDCEDIDVINTLDGFNVQPRISIPFDGPIDINSVTSQNLFLIRLGDTLSNANTGGHVVGVNQIVWDPLTNRLHVESNELLDQHTRYALIVTNGIHDSNNYPILVSDSFRNFERDLNFGQTQDPELKDYRKSLLSALAIARTLVSNNEIVCASVFTTQSTTSVLEKIRRQLDESTPSPADFLLGPLGERTVFSLSRITQIALRQQTSVSGALGNPTNVNLSLLRILPGAISQIAFGKFISPDYEVHPGEYIPPLATRIGSPQVQGRNDIFFTLTLPAGIRPAAGWPVAIFGHGGGLSKDVGGGLPNVAAVMAEQGVATIAINAVGHGFGPASTLTVSQNGVASIVFSAGGRGIDQNGDDLIDAKEGFSSAVPRTLIDDRDGFQQTVVDLMELVRVIEVGMDVDGDSNPDLDATRISYFGSSLGGMYGLDFLAVEPDVHSGVINTASGPRTSRVLNNFGDRPLYGRFLAARNPSLLNMPGVTSFDGTTIVGSPIFDENIPLRDGFPLTVGLNDGTTRVIGSPLVNMVVGAMEIQEFLENQEWVMQSANPVAFAPYLRRFSLDGVSPKSVIIQFAKGDQAAPNPGTSAIIRAGELLDRTLYYRHDLAYAERPTLPKNPHGFMVGIGAAGGFFDIGMPVQRQIATFFATDGNTIIQPQPARFFEVPISSSLPENLNYIP